MAVPWDFVETPALLNERWLRDRELLARFARHAQTGASMPPEMIEGIAAAACFDRPFPLTLDYLATAIVDMRLHLMADGRDIDAVEVERQVLAELGMPRANPLIMGISHAFHLFAGDHYAAGLYSYLWADVMAADVAGRFAAAPGGLYDAEVAEAWRASLLATGADRPLEEAFHGFMGRAPSPDALLGAHGLQTA